MRGLKVEMICRCGMPYNARQADLDRGWARSCSKSCAAIRRDFGGKAAKRVDGKQIKQKRHGARRLTPDTRVYDRDSSPNNHNYMGSGVDKDTYKKYQDEYGGTPQFDRRGDYVGFTDSGFDNCANQNHDRF